MCVRACYACVFVWWRASVQFSSVAQSCPTLCNPMNCSTPGLPVHHQLPSSPRLTSIESVMSSSHLILLSPSPPDPNPSQNQGLFQSQFFAWGSQSIGVSASTSVFPMNTQDWFPLGWTGWISYINIISTYKLNVAWKPKSRHWKCLCEYINSINIQVWSQPFYQFLITLHM